MKQWYVVVIYYFYAEMKLFREFLSDVEVHSLQRYLERDDKVQDYRVEKQCHVSSAPDDIRAALYL